MEEDICFNKNQIDLLLDTAKSEYDNEHNRTSIIDSKTSIALPIISAYFLALAEINDFRFIFDIRIKSFFDVIVPMVLFISYSSSIILAFVAVIKMVSVINTRQYNTINVSELYDDDYLKPDQPVLSVELIRLYIKATLSNKSQNDSRVILYKQGWKFTIISIVTFVVYILIKNCMGGN